MITGDHHSANVNLTPPEAQISRPGALLDALAEQPSDVEEHLVLCLEQAHWIPGHGSDVATTILKPHNVSTDLLRQGVCPFDTGACYSAGIFPKLFAAFLRIQSPVPCRQLLTLQAVLQTGVELFQGKTVSGNAAVLGQAVQHEGVRGLHELFNIVGKVAADDALSLGSLALSAAATLHCEGPDNIGMCGPSGLASLAKMQLERLGEAPYGLVVALGALQQAQLLRNASQRFAGRRQEQCGLLPAETDIVWGPFGRDESYDMHRTVPVLAADTVKSMGSLGSEHVPTVLPRLCSYRFGHLVLLPFDVDTSQPATNSSLALLAALLSSQETAVFVGPGSESVQRLSDSVRAQYLIKEAHTVSIPVRCDTLGGWAEAEAVALEALRALRATHVVTFDLRDTPGLQVLNTNQFAYNHSSGQCGVSQSRAGLAQLRLQLCKWHPAAGMVGSAAHEKQAHSDGYAVIESFLKASVVAYDLNVANVLIAPHGSGSVVDVLSATQPMDKQVRHQVRALRAALLAAFYADYTMLLPNVQTSETAEQGHVGGDVLVSAVIALRVRISSELAASRGCSLNVTTIAKAISTVACHVSGRQEQCAPWRACRRIGNGYKIAAHAVRDCYSSSTSVIGHLAQTNQSFLIGAAYTPSTAGVGACMRTAMGLFGLFTNYGVVGITQTFFVDPQLRPHVVFVLPPRSDIAPFVGFVPGSVAYNREANPSLPCWARKLGHTLEEWLTADSQSANMLAGLKNKTESHALEQYRDHDAIRSMIDLTELSYEITHDFYIMQRADVAWLRSPLPDTPLWNRDTPPPTKACLIPGVSVDHGGLQDRVATCDRQGFNAYASAATLFRENSLQAVINSCQRATRGKNAERFLQYRLASNKISLTREGDIFTRVCNFPPPEVGEPWNRRERFHACFWRPEVRMWVTDAEHADKPLKPVQGIFDKEVQALNGTLHSPGARKGLRHLLPVKLG